MKASELGLASTIYVINKVTGAIDEFKPDSLSVVGDTIEIKTKDYGNLKVQKDYNFHELKEKNLTFYFVEKDWLKALLPMQEMIVESIKVKLSKASDRLDKIKKEINKIENGI